MPPLSGYLYYFELCVSACWCVQVSVGGQRAQRFRVTNAMNLLEWVLNTELGSSERAASILSCGALFFTLKMVMIVAVVVVVCM